MSPSEAVVPEKSGNSTDLVLNESKDGDREEGAELSVTKDVASPENRWLTVYWLHFSAFWFMFIQGIVYAAVDVDLAVEPTAGFQVYCDSTITSNDCGGTWDRTPAIQKLPDQNPIWLMPFFVLLAAADHLVTFLYATYYEESAKFWLYTVGSNPFRWIEYSISASAMVWGITVLVGIHDVHMLLLITTMTMLGMFLGFIIEIIPKEDSPEIEKQTYLSFSTIRHLVYTIAAMCIFLPWLNIMCYFFQSAARPESEMPDFVYGAFLGTLILFIAFGVNSYCHNILKLYDFETAEIVYLSLSFTAKTFLAADVFGGLRGASND